MRCAPGMEASKSSVLACEVWQFCALLVVGLRQVHVVHAGGEVHIVVAGTAGGGAGVGLPVVGLRGGRRVAGGAVADVLREDDGGEVRPGAAMPDPVRRAGLDAGQARSHVDLVDQDLHVLGESAYPD